MQNTRVKTVINTTLALKKALEEQDKEPALIQSLGSELLNIQHYWWKGPYHTKILTLMDEARWVLEHLKELE